MSRNFRTSPCFNFKNPLPIASGDFWILEFETENRDVNKWKPFNSVNILNYSEDNSIEVYINGSDFCLIPKGNSNNINEISASQIKIKNIGATSIDTNLISISVQRTRMLLKNPYKKVF